MVSKTRMTASEFFQLPETNTPTELIDGELIVSAPPVPLHQRLVRLLLVLLDSLIPNGKFFRRRLRFILTTKMCPNLTLFGLQKIVAA
jgi:Uma2 family endonuclease